MTLKAIPLTDFSAVTNQQNLSANSSSEEWQHYVATAVKNLNDLAKYFNKSASDWLNGLDAQKAFNLMVPTPYLNRINPDDANDPLLLQILPKQEEMQTVSGYVLDPLAEGQFNPQKALVHKYKSRVLVIASGSCAINCRYCFRRHFPYGDNHLAQSEWQNLLDYVKEHPEINEVILSGGDPLMMKDKQLAARVQALEALPQITRLRIHTRLPVVIPQRVNDEMLQWINNTRLKVVVVLHINHANEIDATVSQAALKLKEAGVTLLNQGVILKGINDSVSAQVNLSERLFAANIMPYYIFTLDPVQGAAHFDVSIEQAQELMGQVAAELPGYLVPKLAKEVPGEKAKRLFAPKI